MQTQITCPSCSAPNPIDKVLCASCGKTLIQAPAAPIRINPTQPGPGYPSAASGIGPSYQPLPPAQPQSQPYYNAPVGYGTPPVNSVQYAASYPPQGVTTPLTGYSDKTWMAAVLLSMFGWPFGLARFYLGYTGTGVA